MNDFSEFKIDTKIEIKKDSLQDEYLRFMTPTVDSEDFQAHSAWVRRIAWIVGILGGIGGICISVWSFFAPNDASLRTLILVPVMGAIIPSGIVFGLGILFAPAKFYSSPKGMVYLKLIGTRSVFVARLVVFTFLLIGGAIVAVFILIGLGLAGFI